MLTARGVSRAISENLAQHRSTHGTARHTPYQSNVHGIISAASRTSYGSGTQGHAGLSPKDLVSDQLRTLNAPDSRFLSGSGRTVVGIDGGSTGGELNGLRNDHRAGEDRADNIMVDQTLI